MTKILGHVTLMTFCLLAANLAWACAACGFGEDKSRGAFLLTTGILTFIPLFLIGGGIFYVKRLVDKHKTTEKDGNLT